MGRDFLNGRPVAEPVTGALGSSPSELAILMAQQTDVMADIRRELMKQNPEVLTTTVVEGGGNNAIQLANKSYKVWFTVGGKPVPIYALLAYSTIADSNSVAQACISVASMSKFADGLPFHFEDVLYQSLAVENMYVMVQSAGALVNGPAGSDAGSLYLYGFTIPDYDRNKGNLR